MTPATIIAKRLRARRRQLDLTQYEVAQKLGIRFQTVSKWESAAIELTVSRLFDLSKALDVPLAYFVEGIS